MHTSHGDIRLRLFDDLVPKTVANFIGLAGGTKAYTQPNASGTLSGPFYDGSTFHRVIDGAWIQGGDPTGTGRGHPGYRFGDEFHPDLRFDEPFRLAMAHAGPGTNGSQFFITIGRARHLDFTYPIFGAVEDADSRVVVESIARTATGRGDRPLTPVVLNSVEIRQD
ncbi:peptidylprolyl isomerase [Amycolatopsis antarctica]|uniref:Peptidyl-prolyl cis-trans isomerase n=1 Tax=Amycolatopsis antarctica TaxID=1854586 RepID=A0A263D677_9PSEU|nr:peptidylprolyl isomerase [Amycolatopsis antarctica]